MFESHEPRIATPSSPAPVLLVGDAHAQPPHPTLLDALDGAASLDAPLFVFHTGGTPEPRGARALRERAARWAAALARDGARRGDRVMVLLPAGADFLEAFLGAIVGGFVPVPLACPLTFGGMGRHLEHLSQVARSCAPAALVTFPRVAAALADAPTMRSLVPRVLVPASLDGLGAHRAPSPSIAAGDTAMLQYTSGTTGRPKGVVISHRALVRNALAIARGLRLSPSDIGVSWLPPFHDMGLVGALLTTICHPYTIHVTSPERFIMRPRAWLDLLHTTRATVSPAPNFAYELCVAKADVDDSVRLDAWRAALNGAEPVHASTMRRFAARFASNGYRAEIATPVYGMAESTLAVCMTAPGRGVEALEVSRDALERDGEVQTVRGSGAREVVSVGGPVDGTQVRVRERSESGTRGELLGERRVGEIEVGGASLMDGYFGDDEATAEVLRDGYLSTGDLGFVDRGRLFVTGRAKELVVVGGRNVYPVDVESVASRVEGVAACAAVGRSDEARGTEELVVVAETWARDEATREKIVREIRGELLATLSIAAEVRLCRSGGLPRTTSGKVRRRECARLLAEGGVL